MGSRLANEASYSSLELLRIPADPVEVTTLKLRQSYSVANFRVKQIPVRISIPSRFFVRFLSVAVTVSGFRPSSLSVHSSFRFFNNASIVENTPLKIGNIVRNNLLHFSFLGGDLVVVMLRSPLIRSLGR